MFNFIYYPVSWVMSLWHKVFGYIFGDNSTISWILSIVFLVLTVRLVMIKPFQIQIHNQRKQQELMPQFKEIRKKYGKDLQARSLAEQALRKEAGFNPLAGCLPQLLQVVLFFGLYHVLRSFNRMGDSGFGPFRSQGLTAEQTRSLGNYAFSPAEVQSFLNARAFGVPLPSYISQPVNQFQAYLQNPQDHLDFSRLHVFLVLAPLMLISALATHFNARTSMSRQVVDDSLPNAALMSNLMLYIMPLGTLVSGFIMPGAILIYFMTNNVCTYVQTHFIYRRIMAKEEEAKIKKTELQSSLAPKPGAKPQRPAKQKSNQATQPRDTSGKDNGDIAKNKVKKNPTPATGKKKRK